jgi:ABC-type uncharacterized transport system substrate-binding protein
VETERNVTRWRTAYASSVGVSNWHSTAQANAAGMSVAGGLFGYGVRFSDFFRRTASFVDKILKGTKPGDIPIEQAVKFKSIVNLKTAKPLTKGGGGRR